MPDHSLARCIGRHRFGLAPSDAIVPAVDLLERNTAAAPWAALSNRLPLGEIDAVPQWQIDAILWTSVYGAHSSPPPGPNAGEGR